MQRCRLGLVHHVGDFLFEEVVFAPGKLRELLLLFRELALVSVQHLLVACASLFC